MLQVKPPSDLWLLHDSIQTLKVGQVVDGFIDVVQDGLDGLDVTQRIVTFLLAGGALHECVQQLVDTIRDLPGQVQET